MRAVCILVGKAANGVLKLEQNGIRDPITIKGQLSGLTPGLHAFHVHEFGDLTNGCDTAGAHFNPFNKNHGGPTSPERHVGDLGNITADANGEANFEITDKLVSLYGENSILGRSFVVHEREDDMGLGGFDDSLTTGHAGGRVCCGVIGLAKE